jgi:hypothetical protein
LSLSKASTHSSYSALSSPNELQNNKEIKSESDRYIEDHTKIDKDANFLMYWNNTKSLYPVLATIAQHVLSI